MSEKGVPFSRVKDKAFFEAFRPDRNVMISLDGHQFHALQPIPEARSSRALHSQSSMPVSVSSDRVHT